MNKTKLAVLTGLICFSTALFSQCSFDATVTPNNPILCPNDTLTLTTEVYDSYQWYKDGILIPGATNQTLEVTAANDAGSQFYVACTLAACTENSDTVLVDGWLFLLPYVITHTLPVQTGGGGESYYCAGTAVELELGLPYTENITWYNDGTPIPGEDSSTIFITETGNYTASGAPAVCPDFIQYLGVNIPIIINPPFEPDMLDYYSFGPSAFYNNCTNCDYCVFYAMGDITPIDTGVSLNWLMPWVLDLVPYRAVCYDSLGCSGTDTVAIFTMAVEEHPFLELGLFPNPSTDFIQLFLQDDMENYQLRIIDMYGRVVLHQPMQSNIDISRFTNGMYSVEVFSKKYYLRKRFIKT